jgi:uncharacterized repeat protein (TIGR03847 family)
VELAEREANFGQASRIEADAVGRPGQRAFRVLVESERGSACLWVEREQLQALAMLVEQLLTGWPAVQVSSASAAQGEGRKAPAKFTSEPDVDFRVGQLAIGFEESSSLYVLLAHNVESESGEDPDFTCRVTRAQLRALSESIPTLLSGGRPRCPMCEQPLGRGKHKCQRANGHVSGIDGG